MIWGRLFFQLQVKLFLWGTDKTCIICSDFEVSCFH